MKRLKIVVILAALCVTTVWAQTKETKKVVKPKPIPVYLGSTNKSDGKISKKEFDDAIKQGLISRDSTGRAYRVDGFLLTYAERNLYEDSVGNPLILTDFLSEVCYGDSLNTFLKNNITERSKQGDTVYFDQISVISPEGQNLKGKSMRFVLTK
jgi:hypothetical protein